jgi:3-hydroxyacyl-[acyl-carrier-protein] dehydratase
MHERLCDPSEWRDAPLVHDLTTLGERLPQRHEMALLHGIVHHDREEHFGVGIHDASPDDFWVRGHIPGRPLMPAVVMVEIAAQLCAWLASHAIDVPDGRFIGFAGLDEARFRGSVAPGERLIIAAAPKRIRSRLAHFHSQAFAGDKLVFEGVIIGTAI